MSIRGPQRPIHPPHPPLRRDALERPRIHQIAPESGLRALARKVWRAIATFFQKLFGCVQPPRAEEPIVLVSRPPLPPPRLPPPPPLSARLPRVPHPDTLEPEYAVSELDALSESVSDDSFVEPSVEGSVREESPISSEGRASPVEFEDEAEMSPFREESSTEETSHSAGTASTSGATGSVTRHVVVTPPGDLGGLIAEQQAKEVVNIAMRALIAEPVGVTPPTAAEEFFGAAMPSVAGRIAAAGGAGEFVRPVDERPFRFDPSDPKAQAEADQLAVQLREIEKAGGIPADFRLPDAALKGAPAAGARGAFHFDLAGVRKEDNLLWILNGLSKISAKMDVRIPNARTCLYATYGKRLVDQVLQDLGLQARSEYTLGDVRSILISIAATVTIDDLHDAFVALRSGGMGVRCLLTEEESAALLIQRDFAYLTPPQLAQLARLFSTVVLGEKKQSVLDAFVDKSKPIPYAKWLGHDCNYLLDVASLAAATSEEKELTLSEFLAKSAAYKALVRGQVIALSNDVLVCAGVYSNREADFHAVFFRKASDPETLHVAVRGTVSPQNWIDDAHPFGVGIAAFEAAQDDLIKILKMSRATEVVFSGHSLGGSHAQRLTAAALASIPELKSVRLYTHNAPAVEKGTNRVLAAHLKDKTVKLVHVQYDGDIVQCCGSELLGYDVPGADVTIHRFHGYLRETAKRIVHSTRGFLEPGRSFSSRKILEGAAAAPYLGPTAASVALGAIHYGAGLVGLAIARGMSAAGVPLRAPTCYLVHGRDRDGDGAAAAAAAR